MKCTLKIATVVLMFGTTVATAQTTTPAQPFVEWYREMQTLQTFNWYLKGSAPALRDTADAPIGDESFAERFASMQQASANSPVPVFEVPPRLTTAAADPVGNESFAERFREMQAASSNSGQWGFQPGTDELASEANSTLVVAAPFRGVTRH